MVLFFDFFRIKINSSVKNVFVKMYLMLAQEIAPSELLDFSKFTALF